ncbi:MAG: STAS/SEC14 domain-containing protein [Patescibacteria group bacterium]|nr:STAS/SEC14 domain-containing protein [Patescibacteria group bacterium]
MTDATRQDTQTQQNEVSCENGILVYRLLMPVDDHEAERLDGAGRAFLERKEADKVLIDIRRSSNFSSAARKRWVEFLRNPGIKKTAIFGGNTFVRTLAVFVIGASKMGNIKFFATEQEALEWLRSS